MGLYHSPRIVTSGLVGYWDAGNTKSYPGSGTTWYDLSGNGNHGTLQASPTYSSGAFTFTTASSQYVSTTNSFVNPTTGSLSVWFKTSTASGTKLAGLENAQTGTGSSAFDRMIYMGNNGYIYGAIYDGAQKSAASSSTLTDNQWHYACITYTNSGSLILYIDGVLNNSTAIGTAQNYTGYLRIASYKLTGVWSYSAGDSYFTGSIAIVKLYNRALSAEEIAQNFNALRGRFSL